MQHKIWDGKINIYHIQELILVEKVWTSRMGGVPYQNPPFIERLKRDPFVEKGAVKKSILFRHERIVLVCIL